MLICVKCRSPSAMLKGATRWHSMPHRMRLRTVRAAISSATYFSTLVSSASSRVICQNQRRNYNHDAPEGFFFPSNNSEPRLRPQVHIKAFAIGQRAGQKMMTAVPNCSQGICHCDTRDNLKLPKLC